MLVIGERADGSRYGGNAIAIAPNPSVTETGSVEASSSFTLQSS